MNIRCENYEKTMNSQIPLWVPSRIPLEFPRIPLGFISHHYPYCAQGLGWTPQAFPTLSYYELTMRKLSEKDGFPNPLLDSLQTPFGVPPESLWDLFRITIHTVQKVWAGRLRPF